MKRVVVFENTGGGKSTLARQLTRSRGCQFTSWKFMEGGEAVPSGSLLVADKTFGQGALCWFRRIAEEQPALEQHDIKLQGHTLCQQYVKPPGTRY